MSEIKMSASVIWCAIIVIGCVSADTVTWPGCPNPIQQPRRVIQPDAPDNNATILYLKECSINHIQSSHLVLPNLETLILTTNNIENINSDVFKSLPKLRSLYLGSNKLRGKNMSSNVFKNCRHLERIGFTGLDMSGTSGKLLEGLDSINALWLDSCYLKEMPLFAARPSLIHLNLYNNQIKALDNTEVFKSLRNLQRLHLYNNLIENITENTFRYLMNLVSVHLNQNKIRFLPDYLFADLTNLKKVDLENNHIEHIPPNVFSGCENLSDINLSNNKFTFLPDNFVATVRSLKTFSFDRNPWQCGCLNDVLIEVKEKGVKYVDKYYNGSVPVCVCLDFRCHRLKDVYRDLYEAMIQGRGQVV